MKRENISKCANQIESSETVTNYKDIFKVSKADLEHFGITISTIEDPKMRVQIHLLSRMTLSNTITYELYEEMAVCNVHNPSLIFSAINELISKNIMMRVCAGHFLVNPRLVVLCGEQGWRHIVKKYNLLKQQYERELKHRASKD